MRISGRSCMSFYTRRTKTRCVRYVRCGPVDAYLYMNFFPLHTLNCDSKNVPYTRSPSGE
uniref:SFRICE_023193 n=1 Tax=Spodoptera frugiperda TaxID=7108 RepID=A0A2H1VDC8_SPOFR